MIARTKNPSTLSSFCDFLDRALIVVEKCEILVLRAFAFGSLLYVLYKVALAH